MWVSFQVHDGAVGAAGAVQFLFELLDGRKYIHCGDMRYHPRLTQSPNLQRFVRPTAVFLDTTYCKPQYTFPSQVLQNNFLALQLACLATPMQSWQPLIIGMDWDGLIQEEVVEYVASTMQKFMEEDINHRRLYLIQTYCIGKERLFIEVRPVIKRNMAQDGSATDSAMAS